MVYQDCMMALKEELDSNSCTGRRHMRECSDCKKKKCARRDAGPSSDHHLTSFLHAHCSELR